MTCAAVVGLVFPKDSRRAASGDRQLSRIGNFMMAYAHTDGSEQVTSSGTAEIQTIVKGRARRRLQAMLSGISSASIAALNAAYVDYKRVVLRPALREDYSRASGVCGKPVNRFGRIPTSPPERGIGNLRS